ncbi:MAG: peptidoglycan recognition protein family protein [Lachnospiraceae bacterium]|nr:peptidoglycan recognition protein family protein [Lachnospiraceae bacterium]
MAKKFTKKQKKQLLVEIVVLFLATVGAFSIIVFAGSKIASVIDSKQYKIVEERPEMDVQLLQINKYSRPGTKNSGVKNIVVHYTANPGTTAQQNRDYFNGLATSHLTSASSHFVIGTDGEIIQCIPTDEIAYANYPRNEDTVTIECCHLDDSGEFTDATYDSLVKLTAFLMGKYYLTTDDVVRHYDITKEAHITAKECPKYYVDNPEAWEQFLTDVDEYIDKNGIVVDKEDVPETE